MQGLALGEMQLDNLIVGPHPGLRPIKDPDVRKTLRLRAPWQTRQGMYEQLRKITGDEREWSLLHPFDDMPKTWMKDAIEAAKLSKQKGYLALYPNKEEGERLLGALLWADQLEFLDSLLLSPQEIHARRVDEERQRRAAEEEAKKRAAEQQRQAKIDEQDREAKKLLRGALQLNTRSGFEKQVKQRLREIIDKYPDTPSARRAQEQLDRMK